MQWEDEGIIIHIRKLGERDLIMQAFTNNHGRHAGVIKNGAVSKKKTLYQIGNEVALNWKARLSDHLGFYNCEVIKSHTAHFFSDPEYLLMIESASELIYLCLAEREAHEKLFFSFQKLLRLNDSDDKLKEYILWELHLLSELGYALSLDQCAVTGSKNDLAYISPKTGHIVCEEVGEEYKHLLFKVPSFFLQESYASRSDLVNALTITEYFINKNILSILGRKMPFARERLKERVKHMNNQKMSRIA